MHPNSLMVSTSDYYDTDQEFDAGRNKVHTIFHPFEVNKMSSNLDWELNTGGPALFDNHTRLLYCI